MTLTHLLKLGQEGLQYAGYAIVFLTMISVLVAAHELGHYVFARWFGMGVEEFSIGFGKKPLFIWMRRRYLVPIGPGEDGYEATPDASASGDSPTFGSARFFAKSAAASSPNLATALASSLEGKPATEPGERVMTPAGPALREATDFTIRPLPLGGFVRIKGMMPEDDGSETRIPGGFYSKSPWKRFLVLLAGPMFSLLAGVLVLVPSLMIDGQEEPVHKPVLGFVEPKSAAERAGLKKGDVITAIDGQPIGDFYLLIQSLQASKGRTLSLKVDRGGKTIAMSLTPVLDPNGPSPVRGPDLQFTDEKAVQYKMGAQCEYENVHLSFPAALVAAIAIPFDAANHLLGLVRKPQEFSDNVGGPATMASAAADATRAGIWKVIELAGLLSISVGILNLLPAPPLDGGQMAMAVAEMLRGGRRLSIRAQAIAGGLGLTFVAALIFAALAVDFKRFTTPEKPLLPIAPAAGSASPAKR